MADIELVIKVPEEDYERLKVYKKAPFCSFPSRVYEAIANGAPLPKGHGVLKDAGAMINKLCTHEASEFFGSITCAEIMDFINNEKPIVEADKAEGDTEKRKLCINYEDGCEEWDGCPCVYYKTESEE